jgi:hypothetical protein
MEGSEAEMLTLIVIAGFIWLLIATIFVLSLAMAARLERSSMTAKGPPETAPLALKPTTVAGASPDSSGALPASLPPLKLPAHA